MEGAIFDVDGTIIDSMGAWLDVANRFFAGHGVCLSSEQMIEFQSMSLEESLPAIQREYLPELSYKQLFEEITELIEYEYANTIPEKEGAAKYMRMLCERGVRIAVATSGVERLCKAALKRLGMLDYIDAFAYSAEVGCGKKQPDIYLLAAKRIGCDPKSCTVYEDIVDGIISAGSAGFYTIAIEDKTNILDKERLIQLSDRYITGWAELLSNI